MEPRWFLSVKGPCGTLLDGSVIWGHVGCYWKKMNNMLELICGMKDMMVWNLYAF